jgi:hypothetical protein
VLQDESRFVEKTLNNFGAMQFSLAAQGERLATHQRDHSSLQPPAPFSRLIALCTASLSIIAWYLCPNEVVLRWLAEGSLVENLKIVLYLVATGWLLLARHLLPKSVTLALAVTVLAFAAREADWHIAFTGTSMLRLTYYLRPAPATHKAASLVVIGMLLTSWIYLLHTTVRARRARRPSSGPLRANVITIIAMLVATKIVDRMLSVATNDFGLFVGSAGRALQLALEEPMEMMLPVMLVAAAWQ